jgi:putative ABC transport system permease protein
MTRRLTAAGLSRRNLAASRGGLFALAIVVLIATAAIVGWPRLNGALLDDDLAYRASSAGAVLRDLQSSVDAEIQPGLASGDPFTGTVEPVWDALPHTLSTIRRTLPPALRTIVEPGRYVGRDDGPSGNGVPASGSPNAPVASSFDLSIEANPELKTDAILDHGSWPAAIKSITDPEPLQVVTTTASAKTLHWKVGETQTLSLAFVGEQTVVLAGTVKPRDVGTDFWQLDRSRAAAGYVSSPDGDHKTYHAVIWMDASSWPVVALAFKGESVRYWYPVNGKAMTVAALPAIGADLQRFLSVPRQVGTVDPPVSLRFSTGLQSIVNDFDARAAPATALLAVIATGPLGTGLAVLLLGVILLVDRRFSSLALIRSRGATEGRVRIMVAIETAVATIPAAIVGTIAAIWLTTGPVAWSAIVAAVACALVPPVAAAVRAGAFPAKASRTGIARRGRWRWVVEILLVALAALSVVLLLQRGLAPSSTSVGADPLLTLVPLLLAAASAVLVLRFFPFALAWLGAVLRRRKSAVGYIGWATSARGRTRFIPVFAVIAGVGVAVFSLSILATERAGIEDAALSQVGAPISITGTAFSQSTVKRLEAIPGLANVTPINSAGGVSLSGVDENIALFTVDGRRLAALQAALPPSLREFASLGTLTHGRAIAVGGGFQQHPRTDSTIESTPPVPVHLIEESGAASKFISDAPWLLVDRAAIPANSILPSQALAVLAAVQPGTDVAAVRARILTLAGSGAVVTSTSDIVGQLRAAPLVTGLEDISLAAVLLSGLMCVIALMLTLVMNSGERIRLVAELRVLGFSRRQSGALTAWEVAPTSVLGIVAGGIVGVVLAIVVVASTNLAGLVGSASRPILVIDPAYVGAVIAAFGVAAIVATVIAIALARRISPARVLRFTGED